MFLTWFVPPSCFHFNFSLNSNSLWPYWNSFKALGMLVFGNVYNRCRWLSEYICKVGNKLTLLIFLLEDFFLCMGIFYVIKNLLWFCILVCSQKWYRHWTTRTTVTLQVIILVASKILFASPYNCAQLKKLLSVITYHMGGLYRYTFHFEHWHVDVKHSFFVFSFIFKCRNLFI